MDSRINQPTSSQLENTNVFLDLCTTVATLEQAKALAKSLVEQYQVACIHIAAIESVYVWQDQLCEELEYRLSCKISASKYDEIEAAIRLHHPYELPAIYATHIVQIQSDFAFWLKQVEKTRRSNH